MTIIQKAITALKDYLRAFVKRRDHGDPMDWTWANDPFYGAKKSLTDVYMAPSWLGKMDAERKRFNGLSDAQRRNEKLASLARYIEGAKAVVEKRKAQKKKHSDVLAAIQQAQHERLGIESGSIVWSECFGAWVQKEKA